MGGELGDPIW